MSGSARFRPGRDNRSGLVSFFRSPRSTAIIPPEPLVPTPHDVVSAIPVLGQSGASRTLLRDLLVSRMIYALADNENPRALVATDPTTGATVLGIVYFGRIFWLDATDTTTENDGTSTLVTYDNKRYKIDTLRTPFSALDKDLTTPPANPAVGDAYLVYQASTGDWAGHTGAIAVHTARGWEFVVPGIGAQLYLEDQDSYYHRDVNGNWQLGFGAQALQSSSVPVSALINRPVRWFIINQTTNAPPGSPAVGDAYIIGSSPTGTWAGNAAKIAVCESGTTFTIYTPRTGEIVFDILNNGDYRYSGTAWVSAVGQWIGFSSQFTQGTGSTATAGSGIYDYSAVTAPTTTPARREDSVTIAYTARRTGAKLRFHYDARLIFADTNGYTVALFRDTEVNAIAWRPITGTGSANINMTFVVTAVDAAAHTYKIGIVTGTGAAFPTSFAARTFTLEEGA